jgi:aldose 1-epimerase
VDRDRRRRALGLVDERLLPTEVTAAPPELDFASGRPVGSAQLDNAFTDVAFDAQGRAAATVVDGAGVGTRLGFGTATPWVQVCTSDWPGHPGHRAGIAVEPMTCPPDAFRSGTDLVVLAPAGQDGDEFSGSWGIRTLG